MPEIRFICPLCGTLPKSDKKGNWNICKPKCEKCGNNLTIQIKKRGKDWEPKIEVAKVDD